MDGGPTIAAVGSHGPSPTASGTAYFTRLDIPAARAFVEPFLGLGSLLLPAPPSPEERNYLDSDRFDRLLALAGALGRLQRRWHER